MSNRRWGALTDVPGVAVGHAQRVGGGWLSGVTAVLPPPGTTGGVDVRGGGPATRETDALAPSTLVPTVDAVCLTGGSAYGLAAADGVMRWCEEHGRGFPVGPPSDPCSLLVPIVPAAAIFDLGRGGDLSRRPDADLGYAAAAAAVGGSVGGSAGGSVGAGTGALAAFRALAGGVGEASVRLTVAGGVVTVGALVVLNPAGSPVDPLDGGLLGRAFVPPGRSRPGTPPAEQADALLAHLTRYRPDRPPPAERPAPGAPLGASAPRSATTLAVVATDAALDPAAASRTAAAGHDGLARALVPAHTLLDGDTVFTLATGAVPLGPLDVVAVQAAAADAVLLAVLDAVLAASGRRTPAVDVPAYRDLCPGGGC
ncbi:MAG TPA: P1 family peptidase [Kineosporiaceae bacterium]